MGIFLHFSALFVPNPADTKKNGIATSYLETTQNFLDRRDPLPDLVRSPKTEEKLWHTQNQHEYAAEKSPRAPFLSWG